jgi:hypothetical protein
MIVDQLLSWGIALVSWFVGLLPTISYSCSNMDALAAYTAWIGGYVDMSALSVVVLFILATEATVWGVQAVKWVYKLLPVVGGH